MTEISPQYRTIQQLLQAQTFSIDEYQREYKWEKKNVDELLFDLYNKFVTSYRSGDEVGKVSSYDGYFLGSIIVSKRENKNFLVDGQQRVTSLTLLLIHLYRTADAQKLKVAQSLQPLIYWDNVGTNAFKLDIPERLPVIEALFEGKEFNADGKDESVQTMYARYRDIEASEVWEQLGGALQHFAYWLITRVGLIEITTNDDDQAYAIFETMNDRGKPLSPVDMLKAYLLARVKSEGARRKANQVWRHEMLLLSDKQEPDRDAQAIKAWLRAQYSGAIRGRHAGSTDRDWELIGTVFHRWVRDNSDKLSLGSEAGNVAFMTQELPFLTRAYRLILEASAKYTPGLEAVYYNAHNDFTWQSTVLLAPLVTTDSDEVVRRKLEVTATYLDIWIMRRVVNYIRVGYSSVSYTMFLLCREIRQKSLPELVAILTQKLHDDEVTFEGSVVKDRKGLSELALNQFSRRYIFHLLARVSEAVELGSGRTTRFDQFVDRSVKNPFDIEHIWADSFGAVESDFISEEEFRRYRDHVASLLLLPADVNRSLQDKSYGDKRKKYSQQNVYAASLHDDLYTNQPKFTQFRQAHALAFEPYGQFTKEEHQKRLDLLLSLAELVWSPERLERAAQ
ncbi:MULTISPECIES: GmrSD restriction endonuclease domain-containing protein [unclassified Deinococcus]|uniref:GmrSD restriction endonuclease domain-containing protein n=1 Tax=unclassified Deinococcus TaxID=2623546 RepID=UPI001C2FC451|nr:MULTISPECIES: DUF262 domain-containing protein [unclassified Deinococcus]MDK2013995.1 DUF262 domain-containing protein [Deinococcus sp. 43]